MTASELPVDDHMHMLYRELKRIATGKVKSESDLITMGATGLVHEAYLRLATSSKLADMGAQQFTALMAKTMRRILIDRARSVLSVKRGQRAQRATLENDVIDTQQALAEDILLVDQALDYLQQVDEQMSHVVILRYFGGLTIAETASVMQLSPRSVNRYWADARHQIGVLMAHRDALDSAAPKELQSECL